MTQDHRETAGGFEPAVLQAGLVQPQAVLAAALADLPGPARARHAPALARRLPGWTASLRAMRLGSSHGPVLAVWLAEGPEAEIDQAMAGEPVLGLLLHRLASGLVMAALACLRPQAAERNCAPRPEICPDLDTALAAHGLADAQGRPARRYAVITHDTPDAGCADCGLRHGCQGPRTGSLP